MHSVQFVANITLLRVIIPIFLVGDDEGDFDALVDPGGSYRCIQTNDKFSASIISFINGRNYEQYK